MMLWGAMRERMLLGVAALLAVVLGGALAANVLTSPAHEPPAHEPGSAVSTLHQDASSSLAMPARQADVATFLPEPSAAGGSQANVLELPQASSDFVGDWGGYTHSTIRSLASGLLLTGKSPDRISVIFVRQGETVFIADELYSGPHQRILGKPRVRTANPREVVIEYESEDAELHYVYTNRFVLRESGTIAYQERVDVSDRRTHNLVGAVNQRATLSRLVTAAERRRFARPSPDQVPKGAISANTELEPGVLDSRDPSSENTLELR
jgi:hypothetical protein